MNLEVFNKKIIDRGYSSEVGVITSSLFGDQDLKFDSDGIENRDINIFYLVRKSKKDNAPYIIFFNGGPGIGFSQQFFEHGGYNDFLVDYNIVFMDQRGTGYSDKPRRDLNEFKYFTARYISFDAESIRKKLLGNQGQWIVFGQSFGGHLVRKYLELYCSSALMGISHGYGECSPILMKVHIEKELFRQVGEYFQEYPNDMVVLNEIKHSLDNKDLIGSDMRCLKGRDIMDVFSFYFGLYNFSKINDIVTSLKGNNSKEKFINEISYLGNLILNSGILNSVVAYIDLLEGLTDDEIYNRTEKHLRSEHVTLENEMFSTVRLSKNVINKDKLIIDLNRFFDEKRYKTDSINLENLCSVLRKHNVKLHVIGSRNDSLTPIQAIEAEKERVSRYKADEHYKIIFSGGNHREWKDDPCLIKDIIES